MKNAITIGTMLPNNKPLKLPLDLVTQSIAVLAKKRVGKSYTAAVIAEELLNHGQQVVIIDPTGAHWGLRSSADGRSTGYPIVVIGGDRGDLPLEESGGETLARAVVEQQFSAIIDLTLLRKGASTRFLSAFFETLYRLNRSPLHLICDEADAYAPQKPFAEEARTLGAMEDIVRRGGIRGIGTTLITQRPAVINKNVLTQCETLIALRIVHPKDIAAIMDWVNVHATPEDARAMLTSLPTLPIGTAWFWSPGWLDLFSKVSVRQRMTFDSGATPKPGETVVKPRVLAPIDVKRLGEEMAATAERAKADDPKELRRRIADLEKQVTTKAATASDITSADIAAAVSRASNAAHAAGRREAMAELVGQIDGMLDYATASRSFIQQRMETERYHPKPAAPVSAHKAEPASRQAMPAQPVRAPTTKGTAEISGGLRRIMIALAQRPGLTNKQIGVRAQLSSASGTFSTYLSKGRASGWIRDEGDRRFLTSEGIDALGAYEALPQGAGLQEYWLSQLGGGAARMLQALCDAYPRGLSNAELGERAGISHASGTFSTYMSRLRTLELVSGARGDVKASSELFD